MTFTYINTAPTKFIQLDVVQLPCKGLAVTLINRWKDILINLKGKPCLSWEGCIRLTDMKGSTATKELSSNSLLYLHSLPHGSLQLDADISRDIELSKRLPFLSSFQVDVLHICWVKCLCCHIKKGEKWKLKEPPKTRISGRSC